jgi:hypothetical protein
MASQLSSSIPQLNPSEYYSAVADRDGIVREIAHGLAGITDTSFISWYYECCTDFYFRKSARRSPRSLSALARTDSEVAFAIHEQLTDRYVSYCDRIVRQEFESHFDSEIQFLQAKYKHQMRRAIDGHLHLARSIRAVATELQNGLPLFLSARAGDNWLLTDEFNFNPTRSGNPPYVAAKLLAHALHFQHLLIEFDKIEINIKDSSSNLNKKPLSVVNVEGERNSNWSSCDIIKELDDASLQRVTEESIGIEIPAIEVQENQNLLDETTELKKKTRKPRGGDVAEREDIALDLAAGITTKECDHIASERLHLCPPGTPFKKQSGANAIIWAFAEALKSEGCATVTMPGLANLIGRRYGYVVGSKFTDKASKTYHDNRVKSLREAIRNL